MFSCLWVVLWRCMECFFSIYFESLIPLLIMVQKLEFTAATEFYKKIIHDSFGSWCRKNTNGAYSISYRYENVFCTGYILLYMNKIVLLHNVFVIVYTYRKNRIAYFLPFIYLFVCCTGIYLHFVPFNFIMRNRIWMVSTFNLQLAKQTVTGLHANNVQAIMSDVWTLSVSQAQF